MIDLLRQVRAHGRYSLRLASFVPALLTAELFYKFHSFLLECVAFLATWLMLDLVNERLFGKPGLPSSSDPR